MSPTLRSLWTECQEDLHRPAPPEVHEKCRFYLEQITQTFGIPFTDGLTGAIDAEKDLEVQNAYELGFVTAFQLWMEVFAQYPVRQ